jgi:hypothetical protein
MMSKIVKPYTTPALKEWGKVVDLTMDRPDGVSSFGGGPKGNNGVGNGLDPQPPGNPPVNDGPGTGPGNPGNRGGANP